MNPYGKTLNVFKRDPESHKLIMGHPASEEIKQLWNIKWELTEKIDGTNIRVVWDPINYPGLVLIKGRTEKAQLHPELAEYFRPFELAPKFKEIFPDCPVPICIYGEGFGAGIQKGGCYDEEKRFAAFDVKIGTSWLPRGDAIEIVEKLGLDFVPIIDHGSLSKAINLVSRGVSSQYGDFYAAGLVARPAFPLLDRRGHRVIVKIKHKELFGK